MIDGRGLEALRGCLGSAAARLPRRVRVREEVDHAVVDDRRLGALGHEAKLDQIGGHLAVVGRGEVRNVLDQRELQVGRHTRDEAPIEDA